MTSENKHDISVIQKGIRITKVDMTDDTKTLKGATFALYRVDAAGTADVSAYKLPAENSYTLVSDALTVNSNGVVTIDPMIPDQTDAAGKTVYEPEAAVGDGASNHDSVYYLVEKTPAEGGYVVMPGFVRFTFRLTDTKTDKVERREAAYHGTQYRKDRILYNKTQEAAVTGAEEGSNGSTSYLIPDGEDGHLYACRIKNGKPTDITLIKTDKTTGDSIGGARFSLMRGSEYVDFTGLTITALQGGAVIEPEKYDLGGTTIKVVTVPEGGIKIAGLADDTYTLREVSAPEGYIITDSGRTFTTENGSVKDHEVEAADADIDFKVENERGASLPNAGGPGAGWLYMLGLVLAGTAGAGLVMKRRGKAA